MMYTEHAFLDRFGGCGIGGLMRWGSAQADRSFADERMHFIEALTEIGPNIDKTLSRAKAFR